ncbi:MAG TPA: radical SAM protein [Candidatus Lokiarchaeia archaeon]|nr:radical SAM protein [Candidatus Lokiarchaeia archaeon]
MSNYKDIFALTKHVSGFMNDVFRNKIQNVPMGINFDITCNCNLRCEHCYYWASINALGIKKKELSKAQWIEVFKHFKNQGVRNVSLTGGEPSLRLDIIAEANKYFQYVQTATNGIIFIPSEVQPGSIWLSIDGPEEIHNKIRRSKDCFQRLVNNYQGDRRVLACSTLSTSNWNYADDIVGICQSMDLKGVVFMLYSGTKDNPLLPTGKTHAYIMKRLLDLSREFPGYVLITEDMLRAYEDKHFTKECPFLGKKPSIMSFYANMTRKRCVMGDNVDCSTCSCTVPVASYVLRHNAFNFENVLSVQRILC